MNFEELAAKFAFLGMKADPSLEEGQRMIARDYGVMLPLSYITFIKRFGAGTLGDFLHFHPVTELQTHRSRLAHFADAGIEELLAQTGEVLIFADTNNGNMCGWQLEDLKVTREAPVLCLNDFNGRLIAVSVTQLLEKVTGGQDVFGVGQIPGTFKPLTGFTPRNH